TAAVASAGTDVDAGAAVGRGVVLGAAAVGAAGAGVTVVVTGSRVRSTAPMFSARVPPGPGAGSSGSGRGAGAGAVSTAAGGASVACPGAIDRLYHHQPAPPSSATIATSARTRPRPLPPSAWLLAAPAQATGGAPAAEPPTDEAGTSTCAYGVSGGTAEIGRAHV